MIHDLRVMQNERLISSAPDFGCPSSRRGRGLLDASFPGRSRPWLAVLTALAFAQLVVGVPRIHAAVFTVDTLADEDDGVGTGDVSLRDAINAANANGTTDTIIIDVTGILTLTDDLPTITEGVAIFGSGETDLTLHGDNLHRAFTVMGSTTSLAVYDLTVAHCSATGGNGGVVEHGGGGGGAAGMGAALFVDDGQVRFEDVTFESNSATGGNGGNMDSAGNPDGAGGGGIAGPGVANTGGSSGFLGGAPGSVNRPGDAGGTGAGGGGGDGFSNNILGGGGTGGFGAGGGGGGIGDLIFDAGNGGSGGYGGGGGGAGRNFDQMGTAVGGVGGTFGGDGGASGSTAEPGYGGGGAGLGGAIFVRNGTLTLFDCTLEGNFATGGTAGGAGAGHGLGKGGAIFIHPDTDVYGAHITYGTGGNANAASDDTAGATDNNDIFGTILAVPYVVSVDRADANPTSAASVDFEVTFSEDVTGVDDFDFSADGTGDLSPWVSNVSGSGSTYQVTVVTDGDNGTLRLDVMDDDTIVSATSVPLNGDGTAGSYQDGESYTIQNSGGGDMTDPEITSVTPVAMGPTNAALAEFQMVMSESISEFDAAGIVVNHDGTTHTSVTTTSIDSTTWLVTVDGVGGDGSLTLTIPEGVFEDDAGNPNLAFGPSDAVIFDHTAPTVASITIDSAELDDNQSAALVVEFSESVTSFDSVDDVVIHHDGTAHQSAAFSAISETQYEVELFDISGEGSFTLEVLADSAFDLAGNGVAVAMSAPVSHIGPLDEHTEGEPESGSNSNSSTDPTGDNANDNSSDDLLPAPILNVTEIGPTTGDVGAEVSYRLIIYNSGDAPATGLQVHIEVPKDMEINDVTTDPIELDEQFVLFDDFRSDIGPFDLEAGDSVTIRCTAVILRPTAGIGIGYIRGAPDIDIDTEWPHFYNRNSGKSSASNLTPPYVPVCGGAGMITLFIPFGLLAVRRSFRRAAVGSRLPPTPTS